MSQMFIQFIERLAEMFPRQDYQTRLDRYICSKHPQNHGDIDNIIREFDHQNRQGYFL